MKTIYVEEDLDEKIIQELVSKGHTIKVVEGNERMMFWWRSAQYNHETESFLLEQSQEKMVLFGLLMHNFVLRF